MFATTELGPFKFSEGLDGSTVWRTDPTTGRVTRLTDRDSLDSVASTWFAVERWAEPDQGGGSVTVASHERDSLGTYTVLAVSLPQAGDVKPRRLWFSDATGLLVREESAKDQAWVTTTSSDWRMVAGRRRPFTSTIGISSMPANRMQSTMQSYEVNVDVSGVSFSIPDSVGRQCPALVRSAAAWPRCRSSTARATSGCAPRSTAGRSAISCSTPAPASR